MERRKHTIGLAVDQCIKEASEEWYRQHAGMRSREEAAVRDIKGLEVEAKKERGGWLTIIVDIRGRTSLYDLVEVHRYRLQQPAGYVRIAHKSQAVV